MTTDPIALAERLESISCDEFEDFPEYPATIREAAQALRNMAGEVDRYRAMLEVGSDKHNYWLDRAAAAESRVCELENALNNALAAGLPDIVAAAVCAALEQKP